MNLVWVQLQSTLQITSKTILLDDRQSEKVYAVFEGGYVIMLKISSVTERTHTMTALILKELRFYFHQPKFRRIQFVILCVLALTLFAAAFELFAASQTQPQTRMGESVYAISVLVFFLTIIALAVPLLAIETFQAERLSSNWDLLKITPLRTWRILLGKLIGAILGTLWIVWLTIPLFWLSVYTGGLGLWQLLQCALVFTAAITLFFLIGVFLTLFGTAMTAISRSYAVVLSIIFVPLIVSQMPITAPRFEEALRLLSPLCVLIAVVKSETHTSMGIAPIWVWMIGCYTVLSAVSFWILNRLIAKKDSRGVL